MALRPVSEASVCTRKGCEESGFRSTRSLVRAAFSVEKACSVAGFLSGSSFLVRSERGEALEEKLGTNRL